MFQNNYKKTKTLLSVFFVFSIIFSFLPTGVFADESENTVSQTIVANYTINNQTSGDFVVGQNWTLNITTGSETMANKPVQLCAKDTVDSGHPTISCTPAGELASPLSATTDSSGNWTGSGTFGSPEIGNWIEYAKIGTAGIDEVISNDITFVVNPAPSITENGSTEGTGKTTTVDPSISGGSSGCESNCNIVYEHTCAIPNSLGDSTVEPLVHGWDAMSLQDVFNSLLIDRSVIGDQKQYQTWDTSSATTTISVEFTNKISILNHVFGYYRNGDISTFTPIFRSGTFDEFATVPEFSFGQSTTIDVVGSGSIGFAIKTSDGNTYATTNSLNEGGNDHAVAYDWRDNVYIVSFEDLALNVSDTDYNDVTVKLTVNGCQNKVNPVNTPPSITLVGSSTINLLVGQTFIDPWATATDTEDGDVTSKIVSTSTVNTTVSGTYEVVYSVTDSGGLSASTTRRVIVSDVNNPSINIKISASKIVCNSESDLPNWGAGSTDISASTTSEFLNSHPNCHLESGWNFQWADATASDPGSNFVGEARGWNTLGPTNEQGVATATLSVLSDTSHVWFREVLKDGYITFAGATTTATSSAEIYCHTDVLNYDNYDMINGPFVANDTYYCVAFNAPQKVTPGNTPPTITLIGNNPFNLTVGDTFVDPGATATDLEDGDATTTAHIIVSGTVNASTTGTYILTYSVTDSGGLSASTTRNVVVNPVSVPENPAVSLSANPQTIVLGNSSVLSWNSQNTTSCSAVWTTATSTSGTMSVSPGSTSDYAITCTGPRGSVTATTTVTVTTPPVNPPSNGGGGGGGGIGGHRHAVVGEILGATTCSYLRDYLKIDWQNDPLEVMKLQTFLNVFEKENLSLTGVYDQATFEAVERFQTKYSGDILKPWGDKVTTGFVYILTKKKVNEIYCNTLINLNQADKDEIEAFKNAVGIGSIASTGGYISGSSQDSETGSGTLINNSENTNKDSSSSVVELKDNSRAESVIRNAAVSLFALPQKMFSNIKYLVIFLILLAIAVIISRLVIHSNKDLENTPIVSTTKKEDKESPIVVLPGVLPDEEIVIENPEEGPEEVVITTPDLRENKKTN